MSIEEINKDLDELRGGRRPNMAEYIEKATLVQKLHAEADKCKIGEGDTLAGLYLANCMVDELPAEDVEPARHGRWVESDIPGSMLSKCTVCGFRCGAYTFNFCPNCGAKMDGEVTDGNK